MNKLLFVSISLLLFSCTDLGEPKTHPNTWTNSSSENSHTTKISNFGTESCKSCHGSDLMGGTSGVSCSDCHAGGPSGHPGYDLWVDSPDGPDFHADNDFDECTECHGNDYMGGTSGVSCYDCHAGGLSGHPATSVWVGSPNSSSFHGNDDLDRCTKCHGYDYMGGDSGVSCYACHAGGPSGHPAFNLWTDSPNDPDFHGKDDDIDRCTKCHGNDYMGGTSGVSCYTCHAGPDAFECADYDAPYTHSVLLENEDCEAMHKDGYLDPVENNCGNCHGPDLQGSWNGPSCFTCHGNRWD